MNLSLAKAADRYAGALVCRVLEALRFARELVAPRTEAVEVRTILCIKFWGLGNIVLLLPVLRRLRERHPGARLVFVSLRRNREVLESSPAVDRTIWVDDAGPFRLAVSFVLAVLRARRERPDLTIDFEQFARASTILAVLARSQQIVGLATPGRGSAALLHKPVPYNSAQHMAVTFLDLARAAGVPDGPYRPEPFETGDAARADAGRIVASLPGTGPVVVMHPGSGDNFEGRRWPAQSFAALADRLVRGSGARIVVTGSAGEADLAREILSRMEEPSAAVSAAGSLSVLGLGALVGRADALVTNDTAPVHLGSAFGTPVFALFGPNTPALYGPLSPRSHAFFRGLPCSPCLTNLNYKTSRCRMPVCITDISVASVHARVAALLAFRASRPAPADSPRAQDAAPGAPRDVPDGETRRE
jgi:ADP-heptose:LPS heptosyltransferase